MFCIFLYCLHFLTLFLCVDRKGGKGRKMGDGGKAGKRFGTEVTLEVRVWDLLLAFFLRKSNKYLT